MVRDVNEAGLADLAVSTISCARYPVGLQRYKQCGVCPACVFRRQAMIVAGVKEFLGTYTIDLFGPSHQVNQFPPSRLNYLKAFPMQCAQWTEIDSNALLPDQVEHHFRHTRILRSGESPERLSNLICRNRDEWLKIAEEGRRRGYGWARLLEPPRPSMEQGASHAIA